MNAKDKKFLDEFYPSETEFDQQALWESQTLEKRIELQNMARWYKLAIEDPSWNRYKILDTCWKAKLELLEQLFGEYLYMEL